MRTDSYGVPISNMDETFVLEDGEDIVTFDCYGNVLWRDRRTSENKEKKL